MNTSHSIFAAACLCVVAGGWVSQRISRRVVQKQAPIPAARPADAVEQAEPLDVSSADREEAARRWARWLAAGPRDPFDDPPASRNAPRAVPPDGFTNLLISAIWCQPGQRRAVINGRMVTEGSELPPFRVHRIRPDAVEFSAPTGAVILGIHSGRARPAATGILSGDRAITAAPRPAGSPVR